MKKRILSVFLAALMTLTALCALSVNAYLYEEVYGDEEEDEFIRCGYWYYFIPEEQNTITLVKYLHKDEPSNATLPSELNGMPVTEIDGSVYKNKSPSLFRNISDKNRVQSVEIPDSVIKIGPSSFYKCIFLKEVAFGNNVTVIAENAFGHCEALKTITLPDSLIEIGEAAFKSCRALEKIKIPEGVTEISGFAFDHCTSLKSIELSDNVTTIGWFAFSSCVSLEAVYYGGTREQWNAISIGEDNEELDAATVYFNHPAHSMEYVASTATCTESGAAAHYHCTLCGRDFLDEEGKTEFTGQTAKALKHVPGEWTVTTPATCTAAGVETQICARCGDLTSETREIEALGHDYRPTSTTAPTCTEAGYTTYVCSRCGDSYTTDGQSASGHFFGDWTLTSAPGCTAGGVETRYCTRCDAFETRTLEPLGHDFGGWIETREPGCVNEGEESRFCKRCDAYEQRQVEATGHFYTVWETVTLWSCTKEGEQTRYCRVCGDVDTRIVPPIGHQFSYGYCEFCCAEDTSAPKITVSDATAAPGETVELTAYMKYNPGVSSLILGLSYDDNALTLENISNGELFDEISDFNPYDGFGTVCFESASDVTGDGVLLTLTFTVKDEAGQDWNDVGVFVRIANNEDGDDVEFLWIEGIVDVIIYGDANGDGTVDLRDATRLAQYANDDSIEIFPGADANGDGTVDLRDATRIAQYANDDSIRLGPAA